MSTMKIRKPNPFLILAVIQVILACVILGNDLLSINNRVPGGVFPFEQGSSWVRVLFFLFGAVISFIVAWNLNLSKMFPVLPSLKSVSLLAILPTFTSVLSHYWARMGWCCETPWALYFGFPFSFILGIGGYSSEAARRYAHYGLLEILTASEAQIHWTFDPIKLFLNILFWLNLLFVLLSLAALGIQEYAGRIQSESNEPS